MASPSSAGSNSPDHDSDLPSVGNNPLVVLDHVHPISFPSFLFTPPPKFSFLRLGKPNLGWRVTKKKVKSDFEDFRAKAKRILKTNLTHLQDKPPKAKEQAQRLLTYF